MDTTKKKSEIALTGMVLSASPVGEYDRRVVILTRERGKITAFARGARRQNSALLASAAPFVFGRFFVREGRSAYHLVRAEAEQYFREISLDLKCACYGTYFLEIADYYAQENSEESRMLNLLYGALRALLHPKLDNRLVRSAFELRAMVINGEYPRVFACVCCGGKKDLTAVSVKRDGVLCAACAQRIPGSVPVRAGTLYTLQYLVSAPQEKLFAFAVSEEVRLELGALLRQFCEKYIDAALKSLEILETL